MNEAQKELPRDKQNAKLELSLMMRMLPVWFICLIIGKAPVYQRLPWWLLLSVGLLYILAFCLGMVEFTFYDRMPRNRRRLINGVKMTALGISVVAFAVGYITHR